MSLVHLTKDSVPEYLRNNDTFGKESSETEYPSQDVVLRNGVNKKRSRRSRLRSSLQP